MQSQSNLTFSRHYYEVMIRENHIDTLGHVNNATYLQLFEEARWELITERGFGIKEIQKNKLGPVILEINLKFNREIILREHVKIVTETLEYGGKVGTLSQIIYKEDQQISCEAKMIFGLFNTELRKLVSPTPDWLYAIGAIK